MLNRSWEKSTIKFPFWEREEGWATNTTHLERKFIWTGHCAIWSGHLLWWNYCYFGECFLRANSPWVPVLVGVLHSLQRFTWLREFQRKDRWSCVSMGSLKHRSVSVVRQGPCQSREEHWCWSCQSQPTQAAISFSLWVQCTHSLTAHVIQDSV